jgi:hypothetical protein
MPRVFGGSLLREGGCTQLIGNPLIVFGAHSLTLCAKPEKATVCEPDKALFAGLECVRTVAAGINVIALFADFMSDDRDTR